MIEREAVFVVIFNPVNKGSEKTKAETTFLGLIDIKMLIPKNLLIA